MMRFNRITMAVACLLCLAFCARCASAAEPRREGGWLHVKDEQTGINLYTMEMTLHPRAEPRPALKYRLVPDSFDMLEGNAAVHYMKAIGFLEQDPAHKRLMEVLARAGRQAAKEGKNVAEVPPHSWRSMEPKELPVEEVREFLKLTAFQSHWVAEAAQRRRFDLDRSFREVDNPMGYLLPEIQSMRELARMQCLRCKLAIAEGRIEDAITILGQQYALARHLGQDEILVSNLVAFAIAGIAWEDALYLIQHRDAPNLYWAFASIPRPMIDITRSLATERQMFYMQFKTLREVDETLRSPGYWQDFVNRLLPEMEGLTKEFGLPWTSNDPEQVRVAMVAFIAQAYPSAKRYLTEQCGLNAEQVATYPTAQAVFLAIVRHYEQARDSGFKWTHLPYWQASAANGGPGFSYFGHDPQTGLFAKPTRQFLIALSNAHRALARFEQGLALLQAMEAVRMYGAKHDGKLPPSLDDLPVPVPLEPFDGKPLDYQYYGDHAVLSGHDMPGLRYRFVLRFAK